MKFEKIDETHFRSTYGYFLMTENKEWVFVPNERTFSTVQLQEIISILSDLNAK